MTETTYSMGRLKRTLDSLYMHQLGRKGHVYRRFLINETFRGGQIFFRRSTASRCLIQTVLPLEVE